MIISCGEALVDMVPHAVPGGGPMNVAVAAARLGAPAAFVGRVSTDHFGYLIWRHLLDNGVDLRAAQRGPEPTARAIVEHVPELVFRFEGEDTADTQLRAADICRLGAGPHILHGGALGLFRGSTATTLADLAERHGGLVSLDPNVRPQIIGDRAAWGAFHDRWVACANVYKASDEDAEWIWPGRSQHSFAEELLAGVAQAVIVTRGPNGATIFAADQQVEVPGRPVEVVDTVGAGDSFMAATLVSLWDRGCVTPEALRELGPDDWSDIGRFAVAAAATTCSRRGADPPRRDELSDTGS